MAETGHAKNIANFGTLISFVQGYGSAYDPSNAAIELAALQAKLAAAETALDGVTAAVAPWKTKVNDRETEFEGLRKLVTRVVNSFAASGADQNAIDDAKATAARSSWVLRTSSQNRLRKRAASLSEPEAIATGLDKNRFKRCCKKCYDRL
ncbi:MAG TPA: hypothetical protein PKC65_04625 [Pyrinomonadaceae bacterium]|nr:hypothetical protein [Pyrinomonadaceae bacterium]